MKHLRMTEEQLRAITSRIKRSSTVTTHKDGIAMPGVDIDAVHRKFRNEPTSSEGIMFASKREARRYEELRLLETAGEIAGLKRQVSFDIRINGLRVCRYVADFVYDYKDTSIVEDAKGYRTEVYKIKKKLMKAVHGVEIAET